MLRKIRISLSLIIIFLSIYALTTRHTQDLLPFMMLILGAFLLVVGIDEMQKGNKRIGYISMILSLLMFYVSIQGFFYRW